MSKYFMQSKSVKTMKYKMTNDVFFVMCGQHERSKQLKLETNSQDIIRDTEQGSP